MTCRLTNQRSGNSLLMTSQERGSPKGNMKQGIQRILNMKTEITIHKIY